MAEAKSDDYMGILPCYVPSDSRSIPTSVFHDPETLSPWPMVPWFLFLDHDFYSSFHLVKSTIASWGCGEFTTSVHYRKELPKGCLCEDSSVVLVCWIKKNNFQVPSFPNAKPFSIVKEPYLSAVAPQLTYVLILAQIRMEHRCHILSSLGLYCLFYSISAENIILTFFAKLFWNCPGVTNWKLCKFRLFDPFDLIWMGLFNVCIMTELLESRGLSDDLITPASKIL